MINIPGSSNGRTSGFGPEYRGSNPCPGANERIYMENKKTYIKPGIESQSSRGQEAVSAETIRELFLLAKTIPQTIPRDREGGIILFDPSRDREVGIFSYPDSSDISIVMIDRIKVVDITYKIKEDMTMSKKERSYDRPLSIAKVLTEFSEEARQEQLGVAGMEKIVSEAEGLNLLAYLRKLVRDADTTH